MVYSASLQAVNNGSLTVAQAQQGLQAVRSLLLGANTDKWSGVFALADTATTERMLEQVVEGLGPAEDLTAAEAQAMIPDQMYTTARDNRYLMMFSIDSCVTR